MSLTVAFASENTQYDGEVYHYLLERLLEKHEGRWPHPYSFSGWKKVIRLLPLFLSRAAEQGITRAVIGIDNDGGARRHPEHDEDHDIASQAEDPDGCRVCRILAHIPDPWRGDDRRSCVVVPVQALETWLLVARGHEFGTPTPEQRYHRRALKKDFFGKPLPPEYVRTRMALEVLEGLDDLRLLKHLRSFAHFSAQVRDW